MDQNFQTSFIPKKPIVEDRATTSSSFSLGLFTVVSLFIFFTMVVGTGGLYFYKLSQQNRIVTMQQQLGLAKKEFEPSDIARLQTLDRRLNAATEVLSNHVAISPIFQALGDLTIKAVRYTKFSYSISGGTVQVKMSGQAVGYMSVALQADILAQSKYFEQPVFSNLSLDDKGNVLFDLTFNVLPTFIDYTQVLKTENASTGDVTGVTGNIIPLPTNNTSN